MRREIGVLFVFVAVLAATFDSFAASGGSAEGDDVSSSYKQPWQKPLAGDVPPLRPSVYNDEFTAQKPLLVAPSPAAGLVQLASKWQPWNVPPNGFAAIEPASQMLWVEGGPSKEWVGTFEELPLPAANTVILYVLTSRVLVGPYGQFDDHGPIFAGLVLGEDLATNPTTSPLYAVHQTAVRSGDDLQTMVEGSSFVGINAPPVVEGRLPGSPLTYLRASVLTSYSPGGDQVWDTTVRFYAGPDGLSWWPIAEFADLEIPLRHAALAKQSVDGNGFPAMFDFIRLQEIGEVEGELEDQRLGKRFQQFGTV